MAFDQEEIQRQFAQWRSTVDDNTKLSEEIAMLKEWRSTVDHNTKLSEEIAKLSKEIAMLKEMLKDQHNTQSVRGSLFMGNEYKVGKRV